MKSRIADSPASCEPRFIDAVEQQFGLTLPSDYRAFIAAHNGGRPKQNPVRVPGLDSDVLVDFIFGLGCDRKLDLLSWTREYAGEMPPGVLIFAPDPGGTLFLLDCGRPGGVYFWDHQHFFDISSEEDGNTHQIADTFAGFLDALR